MKAKLGAIFTSFVLLCSTAYADFEPFIGKVTKVSDHTYMLEVKETGTTYQLSTKHYSPERKALESAAKLNSDVTLFGEYDRVAVGPDRGKVLKNPDGKSIVNVLTVMSPTSGVYEGTFDLLECGDRCYISFTDNDGNEQKCYANGKMPNLGKLRTDDALQGKKIKIYWEKFKNYRVAMFVEVLQAEQSAPDRSTK